MTDRPHNTLLQDAADGDEISSEAVREVLQDIVASRHFRSSRRSRQFLEYVVEQKLLGNEGLIKERLIGIEVFGRNSNYATGEDPVVRVQAGEVRRRLELYQAEVHHGAVLFELPTGSYVPIFRLRPPVGFLALAPALPETGSVPPQHGLSSLPATENTPTMETITSAPAVLRRDGPTGSWGWMWLSMALALLCICLGFALYRARSAAVGIDERPAVMAFWRAFTHDNVAGSQTDLILPDESVSLMEDMLRQPISLPQYVDRSYMEGIEASAASADRKADVREVLGHNLVTFGAVQAARQILLLPSLTQHFRLTVPRLYPPDLLKRNSLIVLGGKKSNPWAAFFDDRLNFTLEYDPKSGQNYVLNHRPLAGESTSYRSVGSANFSSGVAVLAYIPNANNTGDVLLLTGSDSDATAAAADLITSEVPVEDLLKDFGRSRLPYFEVVLRTTRLSGTAFTSKIIASRLH